MRIVQFGPCYRQLPVVLVRDGRTLRGSGHVEIGVEVADDTGIVWPRPVRAVLRRQDADKPYPEEWRFEAPSYGLQEIGHLPHDIRTRIMAFLRTSQGPEIDRIAAGAPIVDDYRAIHGLLNQWCYEGINVCFFPSLDGVRPCGPPVSGPIGPDGGLA